MDQPPAPEEKNLPKTKENHSQHPSLFEKNLKYSWLLIPLLLALSLYLMYIASNKSSPQPPNLLAPTQHIPTPSQTPFPTEDPTVNWKIYKNENLGFEFKYFSEYKLLKENAKSLTIGMDINQGKNPPLEYLVISKGSTINYDSNNLCSKLDKTATGPESYVNCVSSIEETGISGHKAKRFNLIVNHENDYTYVQTIDPPIIEIKEANVSYGGLPHNLDLILSTFNFLDPTLDTSNWKTISALNDLLSFKYPPDWVKESKNTQDNRLDIKLTYTSKDKNYYFAVIPGGKDGPEADKIENQTVTYNGLRFNKRSWIKNGKIFFISIIPEKNNLPFDNIEMTFPPDDSEKYIQIFDQILSTFKFTGI